MTMIMSTYAMDVNIPRDANFAKNIGTFLFMQGHACQYFLKYFCGLKILKILAITFMFLSAHGLASIKS